jgi:hypothetical protein
MHRSRSRHPKECPSKECNDERRIENRGGPFGIDDADSTAVDIAAGGVLILIMEVHEEAPGEEDAVECWDLAREIVPRKWCFAIACGEAGEGREEHLPKGDVAEFERLTITRSDVNFFRRLNFLRNGRGIQ